MGWREKEERGGRDKGSEVWIEGGMERERRGGGRDKGSEVWIEGGMERE